jgi:hypothetical protein
VARRRNRFINQAALEALVRFGPELSGLKELQREAIMEYATGIKQAHGAARGIVGTIDQARPGVRKIYDDAGVSASKHASMLSGDVAQDLRREQGAFTALTARELQQSEQQRQDNLNIARGRIKATERGQNITAQGQKLSHQDRVRQQNLTHADRVAALNKPGKGKGKGKSGYGPNGQTPDAHDKFASSVENIVSTARPWVRAGLTRQQIVAKLKKGRPALSMPVKGGGRASLRAIKPMPADLRMSVALDIATSGYVGGTTIRRMRSRGWSVAQMGLPTKPPRRRSSSGGGGGPHGTGRP